MLRFTKLRCAPVFVLLSVAASSQAATVYNYTGTVQTYTVPDGVTSINVYLWGAGGGVRTDQPTTSTIHGGGGTFVTGKLAVTPGNVLDIIVGGAGGSTSATASVSAFGGGGIASGSTITGGGGGGRSAIQLSGAELVDASAGGGTGESGSFNGGNGGLTTGGSASGGGGGGKQTAGGLAGDSSATAGSQYQGGNAIAAGRDAGGAGGSGYWGGGGGPQGFGNSEPGGGGSSYFSNAAFTYDSTDSKAGASGLAGGASNSFYESGIGNGAFTGTTYTPSGAGLVVIDPVVAPAPEPAGLSLLAAAAFGLVRRRRK